MNNGYVGYKQTARVCDVNDNCPSALGPSNLLLIESHLTYVRI